MSEHSRRNFIKTASIGAAAVGTLAVAPSVASAAPANSDAHPLDSGKTHDGSFTVWVKNANAGQLTVMAGESEITYTDRKLAKRLARLAARANS